ncbi:MAG TPA: type III pantothenate kinase [Tepidisphaeraceae bacterium]|nr:type III pantothenate kinase [Tepidisphaeraceae bacterium]
MDINLVVLNLGNTRLAIGAFKAGELVSTARISNNRPAEWTTAIEQAWNLLPGHKAVIAASVSPKLEKTLEQTIDQSLNQQLQWVGRQIDLPIEVATENPRQTGIDRVLNVAAAYEQMEKACIVVDAGTAITIDCCNDKGEFVGGAIAPGIEMQLDALHDRTAALPRVDFAIPQNACGRSTAEAIQSGVYHGIRGLVKEIAEGYAMQLSTWPEIIGTGGDAEKLFSGWELIHAIAPDLTLYGIAMAYTEHHINHDT